MSGFNVREYWETRLHDSYSLDGVGYYGLGEPFNNWMYRVRRHLFLRRVRPLVEGRNLSVLDVGSGTGFYIDRWRELGVRSITGADLTDVAVEHLRRRFPEHEFRRLDIGDEPNQIPDQQFDMISIMDVLYHIVDDTKYQRAFTNLANLLRPGGLLLFTENFLHTDTRRGVHQVERSLGAIEGTVHKAGLEVLTRHPVFVLMNAPVDSQSRLRWFFWRGVKGAAARLSGAGYALGACLYLPEILLAASIREGPSTEFMVCRKKS